MNHYMPSVAQRAFNDNGTPTPTWRHPWCGLFVRGANAQEIAKQVPDMVRPVERRAKGPRDV